MVKSDSHFTKYVVCPKCEQIYHRRSCKRTGSKDESMVCTFCEFSNKEGHSRTQCGQQLLKTVHLNSGKTVLYPFKTYCYYSIQSYLEQYLLQPEFMENCDHWKKNPAKPDDLLVREMYDGNIWCEFLDVLTMSTMIGLMLNVDWFQPFECTCYSVGVLYLTIINLPRRLRYKRCNILIIGIIPGPSERAHDINSYLQPLVNELLVFWKGLLMEVRRGPSIMSENVRCVLLCCTCDSPAERKVCGFLGHTARLGCFKCLKQFKGSVGAMHVFCKETSHSFSQDLIDSKVSACVLLFLETNCALGQWPAYELD